MVLIFLGKMCQILMLKRCKWSFLDMKQMELHPDSTGQQMSARMLEKFSTLVVEGVRTDKGFKDCHCNGIAKDLQAFMGAPVTASQV
jgi:hypothetical protein